MIVAGLEESTVEKVDLRSRSTASSPFVFRYPKTVTIASKLQLRKSLFCRLYLSRYRAHIPTVDKGSFALLFTDASIALVRTGFWALGLMSLTRIAVPFVLSLNSNSRFYNC